MKTLVITCCIFVLSSCAVTNKNKIWSSVLDRKWIGDDDSTVSVVFEKNRLVYNSERGTDIYVISKTKVLDPDGRSALKIFVYNKSDAGIGFKVPEFFEMNIDSDSSLTLTDEKRSSYGFHIGN
jgi:hypothetical protein